MRAALVVARREIAAQRNVLLLAAIVATFPFLALLLPATRGYASNEVRSAASALLAAGFAAIATVILGATMLASDAVERRLTFYLARPISATALWSGKIAGTLFVTSAGALLIGTPALIGFRHVPRAQLAGLFVLIVILTATAHGISIAIRGGRWRACLDLVLLIAAAGAAYVVGLPFELVRAPLVASMLALPWIAAFLLALLVSGIAHLRFGAWSAEAGHRAWSRAMWSITFGVALLIDIAYAGYVVGPIPDTETFCCTTTDSDWIAIATTSPVRLDYERFAFLNTRSGRRINFSMPAAWYGGSPVVSADQRHAFWRTYNYKLIHIAFENARLETTGKAAGDVIAVAPDGSRVAVEDGAIRVIDVESRANVGTLTDPGCSRIRFIDRDHLRLWVHAGSETFELRDYDIVARRLTIRRTALPFHYGKGGVIVSPSLRRAIIHPEDGQPALLLDGEGRFLRALPSHKLTFGGWGFLMDDRVIQSGVDGAWLFSSDGGEVRPLPVRRIYGEIAPAVLVASIGSKSALYEATYVLYDVDRGTTTPLKGLRPVPGGADAALFERYDREIVRLDPRTGRQQELVRRQQYDWQRWRPLMRFFPFRLHGVSYY